MTSHSTIKSFLLEIATEVLVTVREKVAVAKIYVACNAANKKKIHYIIKYINFWGLKDNKLITY